MSHSPKRINGYSQEINRNKCLTLVPTNESKEKTKANKELWRKIRNSVRLIPKNADDYNEKYVIIKFNSDDKLPVNKTIEFPCMVIVARAVFHGSNKYYLEIFLD